MKSEAQDIHISPPTLKLEHIEHIHLSPEDESHKSSVVDITTTPSEESSTVTVPEKIQFPTGTFMTTRKGGAIMPVLSDPKETKTRHARYRAPVERAPDGIQFDADSHGPPQKHPLLACTLQGPRIRVTRSDGKEGLVPPTYDSEPSVDENGHVNYFYRLPRDHPSFVHWQHTLGDLIARKLLHAPDAKTRQYVLQDMPEHYVLVQQRFGPRHDYRTDTYLYGSKRVTRFRSCNEFFPHLMWMMEKQGSQSQRKNCACLYCHDKRHVMRRAIQRKEKKKKKLTDDVEEVERGESGSSRLPSGSEDS